MLVRPPKSNCLQSVLHFSFDVDSELELAQNHLWLYEAKVQRVLYRGGDDALKSSCNLLECIPLKYTAEFGFKKNVASTIFHK